MKNLRSMIEGKSVRLTHYRQGELWYVTSDGFAFPVPISDLDDASAKAEDKAIYYMRWIRRYAAEIEKERHLMVSVPA